MSLINDELLNDYIDNNLSASKISEINKIILEDENEVIKLRTQKFVHQTLKEIPLYETSLDFTKNLMSKISQAASYTYETGKFFKYVMGMFLLMIAGFLIYAFKTPIQASQNLSFKINNHLTEKVTSEITSILSLLNNTNIFFIGVALIMILLIISFYMAESHLTFKKKIEQFSK